jgi:alpha-mannosidase
MKLHLIPNSHIDPVWLWDKYEGIDEVLNTFRSACNRLDEYPTMTFNGSSLQFYEWVLKFEEPLFARIAGFVKAGRWDVVGGWWVEADVNHPLDISWVKHADLSREFARKYFGIDINIAYLPDGFGMPAGLPKVLADTGFKYFLFSRPDTKERGDVPNLFRWTYGCQSVIAYRFKNSYTQNGSQELLTAHLTRDLEYPVGPANAYAFGVGDHGGGPTKIEIEFIQNIVKKQPDGAMGFSTCRRFFEDVERACTMPEYVGNLQHHAVGCYSVVRKIKDGVRTSENALAVAGRALRMSGAKDERSLDPLWKTVLFNEFHDILPGSCLGAAADHAAHELGGALTGAREAAYGALKELSLRVASSVVEGEYRVFNTLPYPITVPIALESSMYYRPKAAFLDADGNPIKVQETLQSVRASQRRWEFVDTLPARGFKAYHFDNRQEVKRPGFMDARYVPTTGIQNDHVRIESDGTLRALGVANEMVLLTLGPARFFVVADCSDTWGHDVRGYRDVVDEFRLVKCVALTGAVTSKLHQRFEHHRSVIEVTYSLFNGLPGVYVDVNVLWGEYRKVLKLQWKFPGPLHYTEVPMEAAGGPVKGNGSGDEMPMQRWVWLPAEPQSIAILQSGAFACDWMNGRFRVTLVRSSLYGMHMPAHEMDPDDPEIQTDQGEHHFRFCLVPGLPYDPDQMAREASAFLEPQVTIRES